ncbi:MAG: YkgJ family cysteine cluster protein [Acidobacteriota bacterium]
MTTKHDHPWPEPGPPGATCGDCAWHFVGGRGRAVDRCRLHDGQRVDPAWPACPAHEGELDCRACAACCREAYDSVEVSRRDPFARAHRDLLEDRMSKLAIPRPGGRCACLEGEAGDWRCRLYDERPRSCREYEVEGASCLDARQRLGLTRRRRDG